MEEAGLHQSAGRITVSGAERGLGPAEASIAALEQDLSRSPFHAPEAHRLSELGLGERELAAAESRGRLVRLAEGLVLLPSAPARAMRELAALEQPFTLSAARKALGTTRRVAVPPAGAPGLPGLDAPRRLLTARSGPLSTRRTQLSR
ncbi:hypothetical protein [Nesterenkonia pannonica]|uniref:hypothetical protein n=1 Tax=Nesterenkonia pannonica TaxID=1548602 RepID=UPI002164AD53|nr:hypothetical protein [Nesterenkonia pannonica]